MDYVDICPPSVVYKIQEADLKSSDSADLITWVEVNADRACAVAALAEVARRLTPEADLQVFDLFCNAVATYARMLDPVQKARIEEAYLRMPYVGDISFNYFMGLRYTGIDIRDELKGHVGIDWTFASPRRDAETWDYYLYLASLDEPGALEALADKIADTKDGNDTALLLSSLAEVPGPKVTAVLQSYATDARTVDGVNGPGLPISETIKVLMMSRGG